jgi:SAM-dependent methyltransferase
VGCGEGSNLHYMLEARPDLRCTGLDFSAAKVRWMREHLPVRAVCGSAERLPLEVATFDAVLLRDLLHHVPWAREQVVQEAIRVLRPGGVLILVEADGRHWLNRVFRLLVPAERGMRDSTPARLRELVADHGTVAVEGLEPGMLVRALGFVAGWPARSSGRAVVAPAFGLASAWERWMARRKAPTCWPYFGVVVQLPGTFDESDRRKPERTEIADDGGRTPTCPAALSEEAEHAIATT